MSRGPESLCLVRVCRDCCCGTLRKHPGVDHAGLLARLEVGARGVATVAVSQCLLACDESNVVVVSPSPAGRRSGGRPVWIRHVVDESTVDALLAWVGEGGPGRAPLPAALHGHSFPPSGLSTAYVG